MKNSKNDNLFKLFTDKIGIKQTLKTDNNRYTVSVSCLPKYVATMEADILDQYKNMEIAGFRPGKATPGAIKAHLGSALKVELSNALLSEALPAALKNLKIEAGARPKITEASRPTATKSFIGKFFVDGSFEFSVELEVPPVVDKINTDGFVVVVNKSAAEEGIEEQLKYLAQRLTTVEKTNLPLVQGNVAKLALRTFEGDKEVEDMSTDALGWTPDNPTLKNLFPDLGEKLLGAVPGTVIVEEPNEVRQFTSKITVVDVYEQKTPAIDDKMAQLAGFESLSHLKKEIQSEWLKKNTKILRADVHQQIRRQLVTNNPFDVPATWIEDYKNSILGMAGNQTITEDLIPTARLFAASDYLLELLIEQSEQKELSEDDMRAYSTIDGMPLDMTSEQFMQQLNSSHRTMAWQRDTQRTKMLDILVSKAEQIDSKV